MASAPFLQIDTSVMFSRGFPPASPTESKRSAPGNLLAPETNPFGGFSLTGEIHRARWSEFRRKGQFSVNLDDLDKIPTLQFYIDFNSFRVPWLHFRAGRVGFFLSVLRKAFLADLTSQRA